MINFNYATFEDRINSVEPDGSKTDLHKLAASRIFGVSYENVTDEQRRRAKEESFRRAYIPPTWNCRCSTEPVK